MNRIFSILDVRKAAVRVAPAEFLSAVEIMYTFFSNAMVVFSRKGGNVLSKSMDSIRDFPGFYDAPLDGIPDEIGLNWFHNLR